MTLRASGTAFEGPVSIHWGSTTGPVLATGTFPGFSNVPITIPGTATAGLYGVFAWDGINQMYKLAEFTVIAAPPTANAGGGSSNSGSSNTGSANGGGSGQNGGGALSSSGGNAVTPGGHGSVLSAGQNAAAASGSRGTPAQAGAPSISLKNGGGALAGGIFENPSAGYARPGMGFAPGLADENGGDRGVPGLLYAAILVPLGAMLAGASVLLLRRRRAQA